MIESEAGPTRLSRLWTALGLVERNVSNAALALLVLVLGLQVFFRYVLQTGLSWSEEVSRFLFVGFVYLSASYAVQKGTHIRVSAGVDCLPARLRRSAYWIADLIWIGFNSLVVASGILLIKGMIAHPVYSTSLFVPLSVIYVVIPLSHALMILRIVQVRLAGLDAAPIEGVGRQ